MPYAFPGLRPFVKKALDASDAMPAFIAEKAYSGWYAGAIQSSLGQIPASVEANRKGHVKFSAIEDALKYVVHLRHSLAAQLAGVDLAIADLCNGVGVALPAYLVPEPTPIEAPDPQHPEPEVMADPEPTDETDLSEHMAAAAAALLLAEANESQPFIDPVDTPPLGGGDVPPVKTRRKRQSRGA